MHLVDSLLSFNYTIGKPNFDYLTKYKIQITFEFLE